MIHRSIESILQKYLHKRRAIVIYGARRTGKTTILNKIAESLSNYRLINCDLIDGQEAFNFHNLDELRIAFGGYDHILIDEAQRVPDIGIKLKAIIDALPETQIYVTGSSALDLSNLTNEPLTGRKFEFITAPLSTAEIHAHDGAPAVMGNLPLRMIYGNYPEVYLEKTMPEEIIKEIAGSYLFRDILVYQDVKRPDLMKKLLIALALQLGSEVSYTELANTVGLDKKTVERYIWLMEQSFIIYRLGSYRRNLRSELKRAIKVYFWDNGIRNALLNNLSPLDLRSDVGALWENYFITERRKMMLNRRANFEHYFWRTTTQQEIDLLEMENGALKAFEIKWNPARKVSFPTGFTKSYPEAETIKVAPANYLTWLLDEN
jgi:predicted AAA+ superfamily ATPase